MNSLNFDPERLTNLIEQLRLTGFKIGAAEHIKAQNLLILLASRGSLDVTADGLKTWLGPVLCSSPEEQETFYRLFDEWMEELPSVEPVRSTVRSSSLRRKWLWRSFAAANVIAVVLIIFNYWPFQPGGDGPQPLATPTPVNAKKTFNPAWLIIVGLGLPLPLFVAGWLIKKLSRRSRLIRWRADKELPLECLRVKGVSDRLFGGSLPSQSRLKSIVSSDIEINSTVYATARNAGWLTPIYGFRKVTPEYLVMIDQASFGDQQANFGEVFCKRLREDGVSVQHYFFHADPRLCRRDDQVAPRLNLEDLMSLHPEHDLIIFSNGEGLIEPLCGRPAQWLNLLSRRPKRVLLTPLPQHLWGYREHVLAQEGFKIVPANRLGLAKLAERSMSSAQQKQKQLRWRPRYPEALSQRPERWLIDEAPTPEDIKRLCFQLRLFLGTEGYQWLCSCAVYPLLLWDLTVYLGESLKYRQSFEENLAKLVQLPWFRYGTMPDWLRLQLVGDLEKDQEHEVRQALGDLLISSTDGVCDPIELEILTRCEKPQVRLKQANKLLHEFVRANPESLLHDYVLLTFMSGRTPDRLAVDVPTEVLDKLRPQGESKWLIYLLDAVLLTLAYLILLITSLSGAIGLILGLVVASCNVIMVFQLNGWGVEQVAQAWRSAMSWLIPKKTDRPDEKHPKGLYVLVAVELLERFSYYSMMAILFSYLTNTTNRFGWTEMQAASLLTWHSILQSIGQLPGGWVGDRKVGYRRTIMIGGLFLIVGYLLLAVGSIFVLYISLTCLIVGNSLFRPNIQVLVGNLYSESSRLKDAAYTIFYSAILTGALIGQSLILTELSPRWVFGIAATNMLLPLLLLVVLKRHIRNEADGSLLLYDPPREDRTMVAVMNTPHSNGHQKSGPESTPLRRRFALMVIFLVAIVFWMLFDLNHLSLLARRNTNWPVTNDVWRVINTVLIIPLALALIWFWRWLDRRDKEPSTPAKIMIGMLLMAGAFVMMALAGTGSASPGWIIGGWFTISLSELMVVPMAMAWVSKVAPRRMQGLVMGALTGAAFLGSMLSRINRFSNSGLNWIFFPTLGLIALATAVIFFALLKPLKRAMPHPSATKG